jgi:hypothetical protein
MSLIYYPRPPITAVWQSIQPGQSMIDSISIATWMREYAPAGDVCQSCVVAATPSDLTLGTPTIDTVRSILSVQHTGGQDGTTYAVVFQMTTLAGLQAEFPILLPVKLPGGVANPITNAATLAALLLSLPTTLPDQSGVLWNNGRGFAVS